MIVYGLKWNGTGNISKPLYSTKMKAMSEAAEKNFRLRWWEKLLGLQFKVIEMDVVED
jgi:hypothetical protein